MNITLNDLKKQLGPGLGLRKSKYLLEIPVPGLNGKKINILCRSTSLPERTIGTVEVFDKGRKYKMRAETVFPGTYNISILDDSTMTLRALFDNWLNLVDQTTPKNNGILGNLGANVNKLMDTVSGLITVANTLKTSFETDYGMSFLLNAFTGTEPIPLYQTNINIWQLDNTGKKVYGYKLQNAFPTSVGTVELDDGDESTMSEFSVDFAYSEFIPLKNTTKTILDAVLGTTGSNIVNGIDNLL